MLKKTKIICTQGPATERPGVVDALIANGMNCARFNFSHGDHAEHLNRINMVREAAKKAGKVISLILDTKGPEMRLGEFKDGKVMLEKGNQFTLTYEDRRTYPSTTKASTRKSSRATRCFSPMAS